MKKITLTILLTVCIAFLSSGQSSVMDFYYADLKAIKSSKAALPGGKMTIKKKDIANGFIAYGLNGFGVTGFKEMAYFISNDGKKFVAVASFGCGPVCTVVSFNFYELEEGKLVDKTRKYLPASLELQIEKALKPYKDKDPWIKVPQHGTNIQFGYNSDASFDDGSNFVPVCELQYQVSNGTFDFVKK